MGKLGLYVSNPLLGYIKYAILEAHHNPSLQPRAGKIKCHLRRTPFPRQNPLVKLKPTGIPNSACTPFAPNQKEKACTTLAV
jgi:hypothetical protein